MLRAVTKNALSRLARAGLSRGLCTESATGATISKVNLREAFSRIDEPWSPHVAADVNDFQVKLAKMEGEFVWHHHDDEDEVFLVVRGELRMQFRDGDVDVFE